MPLPQAYNKMWFLKSSLLGYWSLAQASPLEEATAAAAAAAAAAALLVDLDAHAFHRE